MNPLDYFDALEKIELNKIQKDSKTQYTKDEVMNLLKHIGIIYRKSIYNGEYIFNIETADKQNVCINNTEYAVQKLLTDDNKYLLFIQLTDVLDEDFGESDVELMAEEISKAAKKSGNISGVILLPPNMDISLITAKLETLSYSKSLNFTAQELKIFEEFYSNTKIHSDIYPYTDTINYTINHPSSGSSINYRYIKKSTNTANSVFDKYY